MMSLPDNIQRAVTVLGCGEEAELEARDLRRVFKRRVLAQLPERHPSLASAHSKFEEILAAFVEVSPVRDESCQRTFEKFHSAQLSRGPSPFECAY